MAVPPIDLSQQHAQLRDQFRAEFDALLDSGQFVLGPPVERFEARLAEQCQAEHVIGCSSGTDALLLTLMAMDVGPGDEVVTTPFTFFSTAGSIARLGATPVFADIDPQTLNIDPEKIEPAITPRTKAIMPVHLFGRPAAMDPIMALADRYELWVIEDAAQSLGATHQGTPVGAIGHAGCYSFYPTKNLAAMGDAGAVATQDAQLAQRLRRLRVHGADGGYHFPEIGGNFRLDALQAAMLSVKLPHLPGWIQKRRDLAARYADALGGLPVSLPSDGDGDADAAAGGHAYNNYTIRVPAEQREALQTHMAQREIGCRVYYPEPLHVQPCFAQLGYQGGELPMAERVCDQVLTLPIFPEMSHAQQDEVTSALIAFFDGGGAD